MNGLLAEVFQTVLEQFMFMYGEPVPTDLLPTRARSSCSRA